MRARLDALSEIPREWAALVARWRREHAGFRGRVGARSAPDANAEYLLYQTLVGVWPVGGVANDAARDALRDRVVEYMHKATREAKAQTSWTDRDDQYERALDAFIGALVAGEASATFRAELTALVDRVGRAARWTALSRTTLQLLGAGTPDVYQGTELGSLVLVDPDNRRAVDFARRVAILDQLDALGERPEPARLLGEDDEAPLRAHVVRTLLGARRDDPTLFRDGAYVPLAVRGPREAHVVAFARVLDGRGVLAVVPRLTLRLHPAGAAPLGERLWCDTRVELPSELVGSNAESLFGTASGALGSSLDVAAALAHFPVACYRWQALRRGPQRRRR